MYGSEVRGGPFDIWGGVEENMEINKIFPVLLKINILFLSYFWAKHCGSPDLAVSQSGIC